MVCVYFYHYGRMNMHLKVLTHSLLLTYSLTQLRVQGKVTSWMGKLQVSVPIGVMMGYIIASIITTLSRGTNTCGFILCWRIPFLLEVLFVTPFCIALYFVPAEHINLRIAHKNSINRQVTYSLTYSRAYSLTHVLTHLLTCLLTYSRAYSLTHVLIHLLTHLLIHAYLFTHSLTHYYYLDITAL